MNTYTLTGQKGNWASETEATIQKQKGEEPMEEQKEYLPTPLTQGNPAYLTIGAGAAKPFGAAKVYVSITYPCEPDKIDESYDRLKNWLDRRLSQEMSELEF